MERYDEFEQSIKATEPRYLHIRWNEELENRNEELSSQQIPVSSQESLQEIEVSSQEKPELILNMLENNPKMNLQEIADKLNMTCRGDQKITDKLKSEGKLAREGSTKSGNWIVKKCYGETRVH